MKIKGEIVLTAPYKNKKLTEKNKKEVIEIESFLNKEINNFLRNKFNCSIVVWLKGIL